MDAFTDVDRAEAMAIVSRCSTTPFLVKLWAMLDPANADALEWCGDGDQFEIRCPDKMSRDVLPKYFRHNNFSSFQRQLNYFGFRKTGRGTRGCLYYHEDFCLHRPHDVLRIRRKTNTGGAKGHHTNKCGLLPSSQMVAAAAAVAPAPTPAPAPAPAQAPTTAVAAAAAATPTDLGISPLNTSCGDPTVSAGARQRMNLVVTVPHHFGTRRAVSLMKREHSALDGSSAMSQQKRACTKAMTQTGAAHQSCCGGGAAQEQESPITALHAESLEQAAAHGIKRPSLVRGASFGNLGPRTDSFEQLWLFDSDPLLPPLSPLQLGGSSPWPSDEPFSPLFTPKSAKSDSLGRTNSIHKVALHAAMAQSSSTVALPTLSA
jgi:hypothetical protein